MGGPKQAGDEDQWQFNHDAVAPSVANSWGEFGGLAFFVALGAVLSLAAGPANAASRNDSAMTKPLLNTIAKAAKMGFNCPVAARPIPQVLYATPKGDYVVLCVASHATIRWPKEAK